MKLVSTENSIILELIENTVNVLCIERPQVFTTMVEDLINQTSGKPGQFILSELDQELSFEKKADFVISPHTVDINNKKILNKLYSELTHISEDELFTEMLMTNASICKFLGKLANLASYEISYLTEMNCTGLLKLYEVKIAAEDMNLLEKLMEYIKAMHRICRTEVFVFLNLRQFLTVQELQELT